MILQEYIRSFLFEFFDQKINSIGLITDIVQKKEKEEISDSGLLSKIKSLGFSPFPTFYYGEKGYLIPNISKAELISLGKEFQRKGVAWGSKVPEDRNGMTFHWQHLENGKIRGQKISNHPFVCPKFV